MSKKRKQYSSEFKAKVALVANLIGTIESIFIRNSITKHLIGE